MDNSNCQQYMNFKTIDTYSADGEHNQIICPPGTVFDSNSDGMIFKPNPEKNRNDVLCLNSSEFAYQNLLPFRDSLEEFDERSKAYINALQKIANLVYAYNEFGDVIETLVNRCISSDEVMKFRKLNDYVDRSRFSLDRKKLFNGNLYEIEDLIHTIEDCLWEIDKLVHGNHEYDKEEYHDGY